MPNELRLGVSVLNFINHEISEFYAKKRRANAWKLWNNDDGQR